VSIPSENIFSLMNLIINNTARFQTNSAVRSVNTSNKCHLHRPTANLSRLSSFQETAYYTGIKIFNNMPSDIPEVKSGNHYNWLNFYFFLRFCFIE
jgi:hypothetical protein